ncbi:MAG: hypothetical protein WC095_00230 [Candidatus Paceibacterota bacterium]
MAEEPKPPTKPAPAPAPAPAKKDPFAELVSLIVVILLFMFLLNGLMNSISSSKLLRLGWKNFTPSGILLSHTRPIASLANPIGARVVSIKETSVYSAPGENKIGTQKFGARGKILQGPVEINGERYWYVDYDEDPDGWVKESDIAYLESEPNLLERFIMRIMLIVSVLKFLSVIISVIFIIWSFYIIRKLTEVRVKQRAIMYPSLKPEEEGIKNAQWERVVAHSESLNENDWRLAIIEADTMLDSLIQSMSLPGDTMGEKMKAIEKSDFTTIDLAWEAHKIRNQIAHEGSNFMLSQREARRIIELYRAVFEEFYII